MIAIGVRAKLRERETLNDEEIVDTEAVFGAGVLAETAKLIIDKSKKTT
jgi:hypothetical protein